MLRLEKSMNKARIPRRTVSVQKHIRAASMALAAALAALTLAGPVSAQTSQTRAPANTVIATIPGGGTGITIDEVRGKAYVTGGPNGVTVIDEATDKVTANISAPGASGFTITHDSLHGKVFAVSYNPAILSIIDEATDTVIANITPPGGGNSLGVAVDPVRGKYYVSLEQGFQADSVPNLAYVAVYDEATNKLIKKIELAQFPQDLAVDPIRGTLYVLAGPAGPYTVYAIDEETDKVTATISMPEAVETGIAIDRDRGLVYVGGSGCSNTSGCSVPGSVFVIDERTNKITAQLNTSPTPPAGNENVITEEVAIDPINGMGYAANFHFGTVAVFDLLTNKLTDTITIPGDKNFGVAVDPIRRKVFVSNVIGNTVTVISAGPPKWPRYDAWAHR